MPAMKKYTRVNFQAYPDKTTPVSATNLNKMDKGIDDIDNEVVVINDKLSNIGDTTSYSNTVAGGSTNTWVDLISVPNLQNGVYMVTANVYCSKSLTNTLGVFTLAKNDNNPKYLKMKLESGGGGFLSYIFTIHNANDAIKLKMYDNIDNTASYIAYMVICRIK